jgi:hypothetical protein
MIVSSLWDDERKQTARHAALTTVNFFQLFCGVSHAAFTPHTPSVARWRPRTRRR